MARIQFVVTEEHLKLLKNMNVQWEDAEFGAPCIDPKRPYGNGDVVQDIAKILGIAPVPTDDGERHYPPGTTERATKLHKETQTALQVCLAAQCFEEGLYEADAYSRNWRIVDRA